MFIELALHLNTSILTNPARAGFVKIELTNLQANNYKHSAATRPRGRSKAPPLAAHSKLFVNQIQNRHKQRLVARRVYPNDGRLRH